MCVSLFLCVGLWLFQAYIQPLVCTLLVALWDADILRGHCQNFHRLLRGTIDLWSVSSLNSTKPQRNLSNFWQTHTPAGHSFSIWAWRVLPSEVLSLLVYILWREDLTDILIASHEAWIYSYHMSGDEWCVDPQNWCLYPASWKGLEILKGAYLETWVKSPRRLCFLTTIQWFSGMTG